MQKRRGAISLAPLVVCGRFSGNKRYCVNVLKSEGVGLPQPVTRS